MTQARSLDVRAVVLIPVRHVNEGSCMRFSYQAEKLSSARSALMLPHTGGEHESIAGAFHEISLALHKFDRSQLDDNATIWVRKLDALMDTTGLSDPNKEGLWAVKAKTLSDDDKIELSHVVDELAHWFDHSEA